ncbi:MAG: hypothetical protein HUJ68_10725 [Clostridia bacterium]|nr:hypothetical protein [Clostridia bacterium]
MANTIKDFFYENANTGERKRRKLLVLKEREFATQKVLKSSAEDTIEGIDLSLLSEKEVARFLRAKDAYDKQMAKVAQKAYRKFLKSGVIEVEAILPQK